jgi:amino acid adenylation domain-containing protein
MEDIASRIGNLSPEKRALLEKLLQQKQAGRAPAALVDDFTPPVALPRDQAHYALSSAQQRLWFLDQFGGAGAAFNLHAALDVPARLDAPRLAAAVQALYARHEILRTRIVKIDGEPRQVIDAQHRFTLETQDIQAQQEPARQQEILAHAERHAARPFDLAQDALLAVCLLRVDATRDVLLLAMHHIISDAWSLGLMLEEIWGNYAALEAGRPLPPPLQMHYLDFALWQRAQLQSPRLQRQRDYWRAQLQDAPEGLDLPTDRPRPQQQSYAGAEIAFQLDANLAQQLKALGRAHNVTLFMIGLAAFGALLWRWSGQTDIVIGSDVAGRNLPQTEPLIGFFVNQLALRLRLDPSQDTAALLTQVRRQCLDAYAGQDLPFNELIDLLQLQRDPARAPLFQVKFTLENTPAAATTDGPALQLIKREEDTSQFDLLLALKEMPDGVLGSLRFRTGLFERTTVQRMLDHYLAILQRFCAAPQLPLATLDWLRADEQAQLSAANETSVDVELPPLPQAFAAAAARHAQRPAVSCAAGRLDYAELQRRVEGLAAQLRARGVGAEQPVAVCLQRGSDLLVALLAVLHAGACYVPLDPDYGDERIAYVLQHSGAQIAIVDNEHWPYATQTLQLQPDWHAQPLQRLPAAAVHAQQLAYVIYTSGSTGRPKGVAVRHGALANFLQSLLAHTSLGADDALLAVTTVSFDIAALELFLPLLAGARLHIASRAQAQDPRELLQLLRSEAVTVMQATPATWRALTLLRPAALRLKALCGGEALPEDLALALLDCGAELLNVYGPTETTIWSSLARIDRAALQGLPSAPLGAPLANTQLHVLNREGRQQPPGVVGELHIGGDGLARGYFHNARLTAASFVPDPFATQPGARMFRTGDLVRRLADGRLVFLGRNDHQIKIRGYRIEIGEVEAVLGHCSGIAQAVVVTPRDASGALSLVAWLRAEGEAPDADALLAEAARHLPAYMLPAAVHFIDAYPLNSSGKTDRKALQALSLQQAAAPVENGTLPSTALEQQLAAIWCSVLGLASTTLEQDFFRAGGHSLLAVSLLDRIERDTGRSVRLQDFFRAPSLAGLVRQIGERQETTQYPVVHSAPEAADQPFPLTSIQQAYWLGRNSDLALGNIATQNYLEISMRDLDPARFAAAWRRVVQRHAMLRAVFLPDGTQRCLAEVPDFHPAVHDLRNLDATAREDFLLALRERMRATILPADRGPLFDVAICRLDEHDWRVHFCIDMLVSDVVSNHILFDELGRLYADPDTPPAPLSLSFRDYVLAEQALLRSPRYREARDYWSARAADFPAAPELPLALDPSLLREQRFTRRKFHLPRARWAGMKERARGLGVSPTVLVLSIFAEVLASWSKTQRFALNLTLFNRLPLHADVDRLVGDFTSSLLLELQPDPQQSFAQRLRAVQEQLWRDLDHKLFSGVEMIRELGRARGGAQAAQMPVVFTSILGVGAAQEDNSAEVDTPGEAEEVYSASQTSQVWLDHQVAEEGGGLSLVWDCLEAIFPPGLLDDMFAAYAQRLRALADDASLWNKEQPALLPDAQAQRRADSNATTAPLSTALLHDGFIAQAARTPDALALGTRSLQFSYARLDALSGHYAAQLQDLGVQPNQLVAIVMHKGWEQVAAALAILKSGAAYMPVDAELPAARRQQLIEDAGARIALTQPAVAASLAGQLQHVLVVENVEDGLRTPRPAATVPGDIAYVIFTSGSTGKPKGVVIDHVGAVNTCDDISRRFGVGADDRVLALSSLSFDLSVYDIFGLLAAGGALIVPAPEDMGRADAWWDYIDQYQITVWNTVPALMQLAVDHAERLPDASLAPLRLVMMSGDWIPVSLPDRIRALGADIDIISLGGATEASIWSIFHRITEPTTGLRSVPYGKPLANQTFHVLDAALHERPDWVSGPLYIGGIGLALGYWNDAQKTAASFITASDGRRLYRTGDNGRYLPDGSIEFLGREDNQVKVQGYRIELGDIEAALQSHPSVGACAVIAADAGSGGKALVAYIVPAAPAAAGGEDDVAIRDHHERTLFKLQQHGLRRMDPARPRRALAGEPALRTLLQGLAPQAIEGQALPKYLYPSAGSLYPVQLYLGDEQGLHYYAPGEQALVRVSAADPLRAPGENGPRLHFVADLDAIRPLYPAAQAQAFCQLEAGYMAGMLAANAAEAGLGWSLQAQQRAVQAEGLPAAALWLASAALEAAPPAGPDAASAITETVESSAEWITLPAAAASTQNSYSILQRQSFRRYSSDSVTPAQLGSLLALTADEAFELLLYARPGRCAGLAGLYRYRPGAQALQPLAGEGALESLYNADNRAIYAGAAFALFLVEPSLTDPSLAGQASADDALLRAGQLGQRLLGRCWQAGIGLCPIGHVETAALAALAGRAQLRVLHSFTGGAISPAQLQSLEQEPPAADETGVEELLRYLGTRLPSYMLPRRFVPLDALPLTSNGKVDRKALPRPDELAAGASGSRPPRGATELLLAGLWTEMLGVAEPGAEDSFFSLGGNSLLAMQIASRLRLEHGIALSLRELFEHASIAALAALVDARQPAQGTEIDIYTLRKHWHEQQQRPIVAWLEQLPPGERAALAAAASV